MRYAARIGAALLLLLTAAPAVAVERILLFISDVTVERNGDLIVTETIRVQAEGREIRRGILRDFPTVYTRRDGSRVEVRFDVQSVTRDGQAENYATEGLSNGVRVRIGSADRLLSTGPHQYVIRYRTTRQIGFFPDYDELYWNATGTGWTFAIDQAEARITLPARVPFTQSAFYTGPQGATGRDATVVEQQPGRIVFRTTRALPPRNGLTVAAAWEKGVVEPPTAMQNAGYWIGDNLALPVAGIGLLLLLLFYARAWLRFGRDPPRGTIIPLFGPPEGMSAAAVRFLNGMRFDHKCFTAAIIDLGVKGHLKINDVNDSSSLEKRDPGKPIAEAERKMKDRLFAGRSSIALIRSNHGPLGTAKDALEKGLNEAYGRLFSNNTKWSVWGVLLSIGLVLLIAFSFLLSRGEDAAGLIIGMIFPLPFLAAGTAVAWTGRNSGARASILVGAVFIIVPVLFGAVFIGTMARGWVDVLPSLAPFILAPIAAIMFTLLKAPTVEGRKVMDHIEGFRQYLGVAEEDRLEALNPPDKTPELFERFLPYAVALDVENTWAQRFAGVLAAAGMAAATTWYSGNQDWTSNPVSFADHLGSDLSQTVASASSPPGSSGGGGSGGGGSSGGGGGGGGGSGW